MSEWPDGLGAPQFGGYMRELERGGRSHALLHKTPRSGQANFDMDDLALAARAQRETTSLEQL
jgi:hypothetical protein